MLTMIGSVLTGNARKVGEVEMKQFYEMDINELCKLAREQQVEIEVRIEPSEYGQTNSTFTIQPWEKYEPSYCPYGQPIVYVKEKQESR